MHPIFHRDQAERSDITGRALARLARERRRPALVLVLVCWVGVPQKILAEVFSVHASQIGRDLKWALGRLERLIDEEVARFEAESAARQPPKTPQVDLAVNGAGQPRRDT